MSQEQFVNLVGAIATSISGKALDTDLESFLNQTYPANGTEFQELKRLCKLGEQDGWLMAHEMDGVKFGRVIKAGNEAGIFSVDVVRMNNVRGPHHIHTTGEIGAIMELNGDPTFDGKSEGWYVYEAGSDHFPTVEGGDAYVLYYLPNGEIEFTGRE